MQPVTECLIGDDALLVEGELAAAQITGITSDSREVAPGMIFAAIRGTVRNGEDFIPQAIQQGAAGVLCSEACATELPEGVLRLAARNPRQALARIAALIYTPQPEHILAITGTDGKTSTAEFCRQLLEAAGHKSATLGTLGLKSDHYEAEDGFPNTTPDAAVLARGLQSLAHAGIDHVALEASSHGLDQFRVDGIQPEAAAFTTFGDDHGDYHPTRAAYFEAKARLFHDVLPADGRAVLNADDAAIMSLAEACSGRGQEVLTFGQRGRDYVLLHSEATHDGLKARIRVHGYEWDGTIPLYGQFQLMNILAAIGLCQPHVPEGKSLFDILPTLQGVPGRLEQAGTLPGGMPVFVDYAHTAQALKSILTVLRPHTSGKLGVVFGCGGDRDRAKRPEMGGVAAAHADIVVITDDNPRSENPAAIRAEILAACPQAQEIGDREEAIREAMHQMEQGDVLVVAGKGHETTQVIGSKTLPFSDIEVIRQNIMEMA